jgi:aerobic-type carbon monoxide dehydrogenase small subunit (CoxS/CutS family)
MISLKINGEDIELDIDPATPLLWALRDNLNMTGTKYGCGISQCGACTVLLNGQPTRSCSTTVSQVSNFDIVTIEGLSEDRSHPVQLSWIEEDVPQCGYCQSGQILSAVALLDDKANPTDDDINQAMTNICRCGTYQRIRKAIHRVAIERGSK